MSDLPQTRIAKNPLVVLALSLAIGILVFHYFDRAKLAIAFVVVALVLVSISILLTGRIMSATGVAFMLVAFIMTGYGLALVEERNVSQDRLVRMFERGVLAANEPVEVTGAIQGQPEAAPEGFYLTLSADRIRSKDV